MKHIIVLLSVAALIGSSCASKSSQKYPSIDFPLPPIDLSSYEQQKKRPYQNQNLALAVAISGGGHRDR